MRFLSRNTPRRSYDDLSGASSVRSTDSYELFGSACSDYSDCEYCDDRRRRPRRNTSTASSHNLDSTSRFNTMDAADSASEGASLITAPTRTPAYMTFRDSSSDSLGPADLTSKAVLRTLHKLQTQHMKPESKKQSSLVTIFSLWNTTMGSSLLTMAWGVERAGLLPALLLLVFMGGLCLFTAYVLLRVNKHHGGESCEVPALCRTLLGRWAEMIAHGFSLLVLMGANIVYWILITNFLYFTVNYFMDLKTNTNYNTTTTLCSPTGMNGSLLIPAEAPAAPPYWDLHATVPIYVACLVFPLLNFKNASFFTKFNSLGTLSVFYLVFFVIIKGSVWGVNINSSLVVEHAGKEAAVLSGMLALSFYIHNIIITIMNNNQRQDNNGRDLTIAFILVTITYSMVGAIFYVCFPLIKTCIEDNLLNNFEMHDIMTAVARILLLFQVVTVYPLVAFMLRCEAILLLPVSDHYKSTTTLTVAINVCIVLVCILFACFCPNIGTIIRYTGAVSGLVHIFALPSLLQIRSLQLRGRLTTWKTILYCSIIIFGAGNLLMQFFINE